MHQLGPQIELAQACHLRSSGCIEPIALAFSVSCMYPSESTDHPIVGVGMLGRYGALVAPEDLDPRAVDLTT